MATDPKPKLPATGTFTPPPPGAPVETSKPLTPEYQAASLAAAQAHEKDLPPAPLGPAMQKAMASAAAAQSLTKGPVQAAPPAMPPTAPSGSSLGGPVPPSEGPAVGGTAVAGAPQTEVPAPSATPVPTPVPVPTGLSPHALPVLPPDATPEEIADPVVNARPARGQPKPVTDPGKQITGGWGPQAAGMGFAAQYYALDGSEIAALAATLMEDLKRQMAADLRFHLAMCYPQAAVKVTVEVAGSEPGAAINDVAFTIQSRIALFTATMMDTPDTPADALRDQAGLIKPFKRLVQTPTGNHIVDMET